MKKEHKPLQSTLIAKMTINELLAHMELPESATMDEARTQYRRLAAVHHPDRGGDAETMATLNLVFAEVCNKLNIVEVVTQAHCLVCKDHRYIEVQVGVSTKLKKIRCPHCKG